MKWKIKGLFKNHITHPKGGWGGQPRMWELRETGGEGVLDPCMRKNLMLSYDFFLLKTTKSLTKSAKMWHIFCCDEKFSRMKTGRGVNQNVRMVWDGGGGVLWRAKIEWYDIWTLPNGKQKLIGKLRFCLLSTKSHPIWPKSVTLTFLRPFKIYRIYF